MQLSEGFTRGGRLKGLFFLLFLMVSGVFIFKIGGDASRNLSQSAKDDDPEERIHCWILSAQCAQRRHAFLCVSGTDGRLYPIENCTFADDRGHALLADVLALFKNSPFRQSDLVSMNIFINGFGAWVLAVMLWGVDMPLAAVLCILFGMKYVIPGPVPGPDVPSASLGIVSLSMAAVVWVSRMSFSEERRSWGLGLMASVAALGTAYFLRSPIGLLGLVLVELFLLLKIMACGDCFKAFVPRYGLAALVFLSMVGWTPLLLGIRNKAYDLTPSPYASTHGMSQTLFHGLGTDPNPWGIRWDDAFGLEYVHKLDPSIPYLSPSYYRVMRHAYWSLVFHHPFEVARIYLFKFRKVLAFPFQWGGVRIYWVAAGILFLGCLFLRWATPNSRAPLYAGLGVMSFLGLFLLQGVLGIPWGKHLYPAKWIVLIGVSCLADFGVRRGWDYLLSAVGRRAITAKFRAHP